MPACPERSYSQKTEQRNVGHPASSDATDEATVRERVQAMIYKKISAMLLMMALAPVCMTISLADANWVVRNDGVGPIKIGMTLLQLNQALHESFTVPRNKTDQGCFYVKPTKHPHIAFMIEDGRLVRVDVDAPGIFTVEHLQVGDSEAGAKRAYGHRLKVEPSPYLPPEVGHYLTARSSDGRYGIRFEVEKGKIQTYYAGEFKAVQYVEGCE
jgi:hypothetical protein